MSKLCPCPANAALTTIPSITCASDFGQIQKIAFQRLYASGVANGFNTSAKITALASWQALMGSGVTDSTKIVVTPFVEAPTSDGGDAITYGGGNDTVGGITRIIGRNPITMSFALNQYPQTAIAALKALECETAIGVYLFNGDGQIMAIKGAGADDYSPIPVRSIFVGDLKLNGLSNPDSNALQFAFYPNWSDNAAIVTPADFNPLTDL